MKRKHKKLLISGVAVTAAGVIAAEALLQTGISVQASAVMMPGIEEIIQNAAEEAEPFRILEIVDKTNEAEIGYYVSGQEPFLRLYKYTAENGETMTFSSVEEGLAVIHDYGNAENSSKLRAEFVRNVKLDGNGNATDEDTGIRKLTDELLSDVGPLSYTEYQEKYFLTESDVSEEWKELNLLNTEGKSRTDRVKVNGSYVENSAGEGDYTKQKEVYYPVRSSDKLEENTRVFKENIKDFFYMEGMEAEAPYFLEFKSVSNTEVNNSLNPESKNDFIGQEYNPSQNRYGFYENVYTDLTEEIVKNLTEEGDDSGEGTTVKYLFPGENPDLPKSARLLFKNENDTDVKTFSADESGLSSPDGAIGTEEAEEAAVPETAAPLEPSGETDVPQDGEPMISDGDFGSGDVGAEAFSGDGFTSEQAEFQAVPDMQQQEQPQIEQQELPEAQEQLQESVQQQDFAEDPELPEDIDIFSGKERSTERVLLGEIENEKTQGSSSNPYIYIAEPILDFPHYKYILVGDLEYVKKKQKECAGKDLQSTKANEDIVRAEGDITLSENGIYLYWRPNAETGKMESVPLDIVTGRQPVEQKDIEEISDKFTDDYYYRVSAAYFCCRSTTESGAEDSPENYAFDGWYHVDYQEGEQYIPAGNGDATYYILEDQYKLTPGKGDYDFKPDDIKPLHAVEVNHLYYKGGYTNKDWLKQYVFNLSPKDPETAGQFKDFQIRVDTRLTSEFETKYGPAVQAEAVSAGFADGEAIDFSDSSETESGFSDTADEFADAEFTSGEDVPSAETRAAADTEEDIALTDYDLIYVNGQISAAAAQAIVDNRIPVIINQRILGLQETDKGVAQAFASYLLPDDADQHYVSQFVYVFCLNKDAGTKAVDNSLLNLDFYEPFNRAVDADDGFREITDYIAQENEYRKLGSTSETAAASQFSDEEASEAAFSDSADTSPAAKTAVPPLTTKISQARAIEYIINYKYKRVVQKKDGFNVLEIHPGNKDNLSESEVASWLYDLPSFSKAEASSWNIKDTADKAIDGNKSGTDNFWDAAWGPESEGCYFAEDVKKEDDQWIKLTISGNPELIKGIKYYPRLNKDANKSIMGHKFINECKIEIFDGNGLLLCEQKVTMSQANSVDIIFDFKMPSTAKYIKLTAENSGVNTAGYKTVAISELEIIPATNINITSMASAEYVGHIDDINTKYDMIYIGSQIGSSNVDKQGVYLGRDSGDTSTNQRLYSHTGGLVKGTSIAEKKRRELLGLLNRDWENVSAETNKKLNLNGAEFRGSGNDITEQQYKELMYFVVSGYPVVISDQLMKVDSAIDTAKVDNSSYMYKFMSEALAYSNVMTENEAKAGNGISFYANLGKPEIVFAENTGRPAEAVRANADSSSSLGSNYIDENGKTVGTYGNVSGELRYQFEINNTSEVSPANIRYDCRLYLDLNFDGNFSNAEEQTKYIEIRDKNNRVQSKVPTSNPDVTTYQLKSGVKYTLIRKLPSNYFKVIPWKLEVAVASNTSIRTSVTGYAKQAQTGGAVEVNVLQIAPSAGKAANNANQKGTWNLQADLEDKNSKLYTNMQGITDFQLNIVTKTVKEFDKEIVAYNEYKNDPDTYMKSHTTSPISPIAGQQMLIIGFDDCYENMSIASANAILEFVEEGRSVIFAHDTTSTYNYTFASLCANDQNSYDKWMRGQTNDNRIDTTDWGVSLNSILRNIVGMDRYGITSAESFGAGDESTIGELLKKGKSLKNGENGVNFSELLKKVSDIAYAYGKEGKESTWQVQGYTNSQLQGGGDFAQKANKVNDGVITQYPYALRDTIDISETHGQYYQLAMEQDCDINGVSDGKNDIVVWYCLPERDDGTRYSVKNDVRNNYYFYSKGNVIYTGAGHSSVDKDDEVRLFINAMIAAANVTAVEPEVTFVESLNPAAKQERVRYYATDQMAWTNNEGNLLEKDMPLYINVTDYNMVSASIGSGQKKETMTAEFYIVDEDTGEVLDNDNTLPEEIKNSKVRNIGNEIGSIQAYGSSDAIPVENGKFTLKGNNAYGLKFTNVENYLRNSNEGYKKDFRVYVKITSTVILYGQETTNVSWTSIDLKQRPLFDLD